MNETAIFYPVAAMVLLVIVVEFFMIRERMSEMKTRKIGFEKVASSTQMSQVLENTRAADNYKNLFEMPVLFYVLCLALFMTQSVSQGFIWAAWAYVALRVLHSGIHIGYNNVMQRFSVFALSMWVVGSMWAVFVWQLAAKA
jgi:hypothetical protein